MNIPEEIQKRLVWAKNRSDEPWQRIESVVPAHACECGITPNREPVKKVSAVINPFNHLRMSCDYCKRCCIVGTNQWFDSPHDLNAWARLKENYQKIIEMKAKG